MAGSAFALLLFARREPRRTCAVVAIALLLVGPGALYVAIAVGWEQGQVSAVTGDEPHYRITADAIAHDNTIDVKRAYERDAATRTIYGPVDAGHARTGQRDTYSVYGLGVPFLVAPLLSLWGVVGARVTMSAIVAAVPFLLYRIARNMGVSNGPSAALACTVSLGLPFLAAAGQVHPDLPTGVVVLGGVAVASRAAHSDLSWLRTFAAAAALAALPRLHMKNAGATAVLCAMLVAMLVVRQRPGRDFRKPLVLAGTVLASVALLGTLNLMTLGSVWGVYASQAAAGATWTQATMIFMGLHFDQAQGIFVQRPFLVLALVGLALFVQRAPLLALGTAVAYLAIVIPNSFHECWYGCISVSGRFMWSVFGLWFLPLVALYLYVGPTGRRLFAEVLDVLCHMGSAYKNDPHLASQQASVVVIQPAPWR